MPAIHGMHLRAATPDVLDAIWTIALSCYAPHAIQRWGCGMDKAKIDEQHLSWLEFIGEPKTSITRISGMIAETGCHACLHHPLIPGVEFTCTRCERLVCSVCGACCCGRQKYEDGLKNGTILPWKPELRQRQREENAQQKIDTLHAALIKAQVRKAKATQE